jgi:uncharacterized cofD-like protein
VKVVAIGGGHGLAMTLRACVGWTSALTAVVSVADDGGSSGQLRSVTSQPAPGDLRRCLTALAGHGPLARAFERRFDGHPPGNLLLAALAAELGGDLTAAVAEAAALLEIPSHVQVLPSSTTVVDLVATTAGGDTVRGQVAVEETGDLRHVRLEPAATVPPPAVEAIGAADLVVLGPGSLYGSVLAAAVVPELVDAVDTTKATRVLVCNLRPRPPETAGYDVAAHVGALRRHGIDADVVVVQPGALPAGDVGDVEVVEADITGASGLAHDPDRLGAVLKDLAATR